MAMESPLDDIGGIDTGLGRRVRAHLLELLCRRERRAAEILGARCSRGSDRDYLRQGHECRREDRRGDHRLDDGEAVFAGTIDHGCPSGNADAWPLILCDLLTDKELEI